jgi:methane/ammonia monooxygenase subunit B
VTLLSGQTVDLERIGSRFVWWWSLAGFLIGLAWMVYWTVPKRTVTRLAITSQLAVNDDAPDIGLITPRDHFWMDILAGLTIVMLVVGWVRMAGKYPVRLPQQTDRFAPASLTPTDHMASVRTAGAIFDDRTDTLTINAEIKNTGSSPITLKSYVMAMASFVNGPKEEMAKAGPADFVSALSVDPDSPIAPGETRKVTLKMSSDIFDKERLIPLHDPQQLIAGLLRFRDAEGRDDIVNLKSLVIPTKFRPQYLP